VEEAYQRRQPLSCLISPPRRALDGMARFRFNSLPPTEYGIHASVIRMTINRNRSGFAIIMHIDSAELSNANLYTVMKMKSVSLGNAMHEKEIPKDASIF
jgi:hypothetical protein